MHRHLTLAALGLAAVGGCGGALAGGDDLGRAASAIRDGELDTTHTGVVMVVRAPTRSDALQCTGFAISPRLVVTAAHCGAYIDAGTSGFHCGAVGADGTTPKGGDTYTRLYPGSDLAVYVGDQVSPHSAHTAVAEVLAPFPGQAAPLCGTDLVLLRLEEPLTDVEPIAPRLVEPPVEGEPATAVGYGNNGAEWADGTRRVRSGVAVLKVGLDIRDGSSGRSARMIDGEFSLTAGPCGGDSGGPALDADGRAIGVMSRGLPTVCEDMIYTQIAPHAAWLAETARAVHAAAGEEPPAWAKPAEPPDAGSGPPTPPAGAGGDAQDGGCTSVPGGMLAGVLALVGAGRRRIAGLRRGQR